MAEPNPTTSADTAAASAAAAMASHYGQYAKAVQQAEQRHRQLSQALRDGTFARHAVTMAQINRQTAEMTRQMEVMALVAQRGRFGAFQHMAQPHMARLGMATGIGAGVTMGMVRSGFSGTAEGQAFSYQWERLNRQLAAVALPVFEKIAKTVGQVATWFEKLSGTQQDQIMKIGLVTVGVVALGGAVRMATLALGAFAGIARAAAAATGAGAALGGVGALAGGGLAAGGLAAGGLAMGGAAAAGGGAGTAAAAAAGGGLLARGGRLLKRAGILGAGLAAGEELLDGDGFYEMERRRGTSRLGSGLAALGHTGLNLLTFGYHADRLREKGELGAGAAAEAAKRRDVSVFGNQLLEAGGTAQMIQEELLKTSALRAESGGGSATALLGAAVGLLEKIAEAVGKDSIRDIHRLADR